MVFAKAAKSAGLPVAEGQIGHFDIHALADALPHEDDVVIADHYLTERDFASSRVIRTLRPVQPHFHQTCDEYIFILSGSGIVWLEDRRHQAPFRPGHLLFFARGVIHAMPRIFEGPVLALSVDTPRRSADDVVYVDAEGRQITPEQAERQVAG